MDQPVQRISAGVSAAAGPCLLMGNESAPHESSHGCHVCHFPDDLRAMGAAAGIGATAHCSRGTGRSQSGVLELPRPDLFGIPVPDDLVSSAAGDPAGTLRPKAG